MQVNLAPELIVDPAFENELFGTNAVLEGYRINVNPSALQTTLNVKKIPSTRIHTLRLILAGENEIQGLKNPSPEDSGYAITTGISPDPLDTISIPLVQRSPEPNTELEDLLNFRIYKSMSEVADIERKLQELTEADGEVAYGFLTATFGGITAIGANAYAAMIGLDGMDRFSLSAAVGVLVVDRMLKIKKRIPFKKDEEFDTFDHFPPKILQIVERS